MRRLSRRSRGREKNPQQQQEAKRAGLRISVGQTIDLSNLRKRLDTQVTNNKLTVFKRGHASVRSPLTALFLLHFRPDSRNYNWAVGNPKWWLQMRLQSQVTWNWASEEKETWLWWCWYPSRTSKLEPNDGPPAAGGPSSAAGCRKRAGPGRQGSDGPFPLPLPTPPSGKPVGRNSSTVPWGQLREPAQAPTCGKMRRLASKQQHLGRHDWAALQVDPRAAVTPPGDSQPASPWASRTPNLADLLRPNPDSHKLR